MATQTVKKKVVKVASPVTEDVLNEVFPSLNPDEILDDAAKQLNMKADD
ncbi:hypothetical protein [Deinococcus sp.]|nr:hypothetical protein [Deinococcus sp.]